MTSSVEYTGQLRATCVHVASGSPIETDAPTDNHGLGQRFSPTDLTATSLATCMVTVMGIKARSMSFDLDCLRVNVTKSMAAAPRRIERIELQFIIPETLQQLDPRTIELLKKIGDTCPVRLSLHPEIEVQIDWGAWS
ncbi:MAG: OsmC family protein [Bacteroidota bacterium]